MEEKQEGQEEKKCLLSASNHEIRRFLWIIIGGMCLLMLIGLATCSKQDEINRNTRILRQLENDANQTVGALQNQAANNARIAKIANGAVKCPYPPQGQLPPPPPENPQIQKLIDSIDRLSKRVEWMDAMRRHSSESAPMLNRLDDIRGKIDKMNRNPEYRSLDRRVSRLSSKIEGMEKRLKEIEAGLAQPVDPQEFIIHMYDGAAGQQQQAPQPEAQPEKAPAN